MKMRLLTYGILLVGACAALYPFVWMVGTSLKTLQEASAASLSVLPESPQWSNYQDAMESAPFGVYFANTFGIAIVVSVVTMISSVMAGYAFACLDFFGRRASFAIVLATMMVPFEALIIPNYVLITKLGWYDSYAALIVPWCASAFSIFLMRQAFASLPREYFDAAAIDGCGHIRFMTLIGAPLVRSTVLVVGLFSFLASYNSLLWPMIVTGSESMRVVQVGLAVFATDAGVRTNLLMAASVVVILPVLVLYFATQRTFVEGATSSGIKG
jgi:multiple sugar transport system permease protein